MSIEVKVPNLPESVSDASIAKWHKKPGDRVRRDENLVDLETDKVVLEVPAPADGILTAIQANEGETVTEGALLGLLEESAAPDTPETKPAQATASTTAKQSPVPSVSAGKDELAPSVRRLVGEHDLDASGIAASGRGGRLTKGDVLAHIQGAGPRPQERIKMSRLRSRIAERMKDAQNTAAILTSFNEVNLQAVMDIRNRYKDEFARHHEVKLGFMSFFVKACSEALRKHPVVNASIDGDEIVYHGYQDIGIAVSTERGLIVPVLRDAHRMGLADIEAAIAEYADQARKGSIKLEDLQGGTFTITNGGVFGSLLSTPLLNMPQSAILGMHAIKDRPIAENGQVVIRPMMYIALSYDHRIIDGKDAVQFLVAVKQALEDPARMLLGL